MLHLYPNWVELPSDITVNQPVGMEVVSKDIHRVFLWPWPSLIYLLKIKWNNMSTSEVNIYIIVYWRKRPFTYNELRFIFHAINFQEVYLVECDGHL